MHDFSCTNAEDMNYFVLADRVRYFKEDAKGVTTMCKALEEMRNEALEEGRREGRSYTLRNNILKMLSDGVPIDKIKQYTDATDEEISELQREM